MGIGADQIIAYDPPGAIGLQDPAALILLRFDEDDGSHAPADSAGQLQDLTVPAGLARAAPVDAVLGRGRQFVIGTGFVAIDRVAGATIATRDVSVQAVVALDPVVGALEARGFVIARGEDTGVAGQGISYGLAVGIDDAPTNRWRMIWVWSTLDGVLHLEPGPTFTPPPAGRFTMITATRRWVSATQVVLRYFIGPILLSEVTVADGAIAGAISQRTTVGCARDRATGTYPNAFPGTIDEVLVVGRELCPEEVEATWLRLTVYQPRGVVAFREQFDPGFPITSDRGSDAQREIALFGQALGYVAAGVENLRANFLPSRAYGSTLAQWEEAVAVTPAPAISLDQRRARVLARLRQKNGISIPGIGQALDGLIDTDVANLQFLTFSNTVVDTFDTIIDPLLWDTTVGNGSSIAVVANRARLAVIPGDFRLDPTAHGWRWIARAISQSMGVPARGHHVIGSITHALAADATEAGVWFGDRPRGNYFLVGVRFAGGAYAVFAERFVGGVSVGVGLDPGSITASNPGKVWLHAWHDEIAGQLAFAWSLTGTAYTVFAGTVSGFAQPTAPGDTLAGYYFRSISGSTMTTSATIDWDDFTLWTPHGVRPFSAYVYLDPALGGHPDLAAADSVLQATKHAYTHVNLITSPSVICDAPNGCDRGPMGGR